MKKLITSLCIAVALGFGLALLVKSFQVNARSVAEFFCDDTRAIKVSDKIVTRTIDNLDDFSHVSVSRSVNVEYIESTSRKAVFKVGENIVDSLYCKVDNGTLRIGLKGKNVNYKFSDGQPKVTVYGPVSLRSVEVTTSADFKTKRIDGDKVKLSSTTSGDIYVEKVFATQLNAHVSTSGDVKIGSVDCGKVDFNASTSGDIKVGTVTAVTLDADAQTSGDVKIDVFNGSDAKLKASTSGDVKIKSLTVNSLGASASTSGDIDVAGSAHEVDFSASTSGEIAAKGLKTGTSKINKSTGGSIRM